MTVHSGNSRDEVYDVAICGAGLAGLTLAWQLRQEMSELSVVLIDRLARPLPEAAFKVGESLVETGSFYLTDVLNLRDYFEQTHVRKMGFRFFFGDGTLPMHARPEFGLSKFPSVDSFQIDRGVFENDMRQFNEDAGVVMCEGCTVQDVILANGNDLHQVRYRFQGKKKTNSLRARWVIDAMGRRRFLQKRLGLTKEHGQQCSAVWFRLEGRVDVSDMVPDEEQSWHQRVPDRSRYYSTNHLMGKGYWVWLIPLSSGSTSVGIVTLEELHSFREISTYPAALEWLKEHEPVLAANIGDAEPLDFRCMRRYSYASKQLFSTERWACVGEAALFPDPFYALASDLIGFSNSIILDMIAQDRRGDLSPELTHDYNQFVLSMNHWLTNNIQVAYPFFNNPIVMAAKVLWDTAGGWASLGPRMFNSLFLDREGELAFRRVSGRYFFLTLAMQNMFVDWNARSPGRFNYDFIDFLDLPIMKMLQVRNLSAGKCTDEIIADQAANMERLEEFAQALFLLAVEDVLPDHLELFEPPVWVNAWAVGLKPERWEKDGLFRPTTEPRDLSKLRNELKQAFTANKVAQDHSSFVRYERSHR